MSRIFQGRVVIPGTVKAPALVTHSGFNTLASFQKALLGKKMQAPCSDQNNKELYNKPMAQKALCLPRTIGSTTGGLILHTACDMGMGFSCMLFSESIDSLAAAGAVLADIWTANSMPVVDRLGKDFLDFVQDGMQITLHEDGRVEVEG